MKNVLIIGATSAIATATARLFAEKGCNLHLIARDEERLEMIARDLTVRGAGDIGWDILDFNSVSEHGTVLAKIRGSMGVIDCALVAHGILPDQESGEGDIDYMVSTLNTNAISTLCLLTVLANIFEEQKSGTLAVISSVAGDRGRKSNYLYGAAKSMVSTFSEGLRNRLWASGVHVLTIKPGFVDTPMTSSFQKGLMWVQPETVARGIMEAIEKRRDVVYLPGFWRIIMFIIGIIPERIFKRMSL